MNGVRMPVGPVGHSRWLRLLAHALLLGLAVGAGDMASMPADLVAGMNALRFLAQALSQWTVAGSWSPLLRTTRCRGGLPL